MDSLLCKFDVAVFSLLLNCTLSRKIITTHPNILHSFIENVDATHPRVSSLPTGMVRHDYMGCGENVVVSNCKRTVDTHVAELVRNYTWSDIYSRPVWVLSMDRVRSGLNQWTDRGEVSTEKSMFELLIVCCERTTVKCVIELLQ